MTDTNADGVYAIGKSGGMQAEVSAGARGRTVNREGGDESSTVLVASSIGRRITCDQFPPSVEIEKSSKK
jgi:hypothetical protein